MTNKQTKRIGVLSNPLSGGNRKGLGAIRSIIAEHPDVVHCEVKTPAEILKALVVFSQEALEIVAVNGGDGTIAAVLTALFHHKPFAALPQLALLRSGTTSMTAGDVGLRGSASQGLQRLLTGTGTRPHEAVVLKRPVLSVRAPGHEPLCGMFFGAAGICQGIRFFHEKANTAGLRGELIPGLVIARFLVAAVRRQSQYVRPASMAITVNGKPSEHWDCLLVLVSTLERLFLGMRPFWGDETGPLHFSAVRSRPRHLVRALLDLLKGRPGRYGTVKNGYLSHNAKELHLHMDSEFALDGELYSPATPQDPVVLSSAGEASFVRL